MLSSTQNSERKSLCARVLWSEALPEASASRLAPLSPLMYPSELSECQSLSIPSWLEPCTMDPHRPQGEV